MDTKGWCLSMQLTGGLTPWDHKNTGLLPHYPRLETALSCEAAVIGGGMSGALAAYLLTQMGLDVVLLEKRRIGHGSTSANTGLLQFMNDTSLTELIDTFGERIGTGFYAMCREAVDQLSVIAAELPVDSGFKRRSSLYMASREEDAKILQQEHSLLQQLGYETEYWSRRKIEAHYPFSRAAALYTAHDAEVDPFALVQGMILAASRRGLRVFENSPVEQSHFTGTETCLQTAAGEVRAKTVIWAAGYEVQDWKPDAAASLQCTYAVMTEPLPDLSFWHEQALIWETKRPYLYFRTTPDRRIIAGGLDEPLREGTRLEQNVSVRQEQLLKEISRLFPNLPPLKADYAWSGIFANTRDGLPLIGPHPAVPGSFFIEGYGGNGTVYSMIAARLIADVLSGKTREELDWFAFGRSSGKVQNPS